MSAITGRGVLAALGGLAVAGLVAYFYVEYSRKRAAAEERQAVRTQKHAARVLARSSAHDIADIGSLFYPLFETHCGGSLPNGEIVGVLHAKGDEVSGAGGGGGGVLVFATGCWSGAPHTKTAIPMKRLADTATRTERDLHWLARSYGKSAIFNTSFAFFLASLMKHQLKPLTTTGSGRRLTPAPLTLSTAAGVPLDPALVDTPPPPPSLLTTASGTTTPVSGSTTINASSAPASPTHGPMSQSTPALPSQQHSDRKDAATPVRSTTPPPIVDSKSAAAAAAPVPFELTYQNELVTELELCIGDVDTADIDATTVDADADAAASSDAQLPQRKNLPLRCVAEIGTLNDEKLQAFAAVNQRYPDLASHEMAEVIDFGTTQVLAYYLQTGKLVEPSLARQHGIVYEQAAMPRPTSGYTWLSFTTSPSGRQYDVDLAYAANTANGMQYDATTNRPRPLITPRTSLATRTPRLALKQTIRGIDAIIEHCQLRYFSDRHRSADEQSRNAADAKLDGDVAPAYARNQLAYVCRDAFKKWHVAHGAKAALKPIVAGGKGKRKQLITSAAAASATAAAATVEAEIAASRPAGLHAMD